MKTHISFIGMSFMLISIFSNCRSQDTADIIYTNGQIYTVNATQPWAEAVAIKDGKFLKVGSDIDIEKLKGEKTQVIDLKGRFIMPGMHDVHIHTLDVEVEKVAGNFHRPPEMDLDEMLAALKVYAEENPDREWIIAADYPMGMFPKENAPKEILDEIIPDRPVAILHQSGHALWVNSKALEIAGITKETLDPELGIIIRKENGEPFGTLKESAMPLVMKYYFNYSKEQYAEAAKLTMQLFNSNGITSVRSATGRNEHFLALTELDKKDLLPLRFLMSWNWSTTLIEPISSLVDIENNMVAALESGTPHVNANSLKIFIDGTFDSNSTYMFEPFEGTTDNYGFPIISEDELKETITKFDKMGVSVIMHCIGDKAPHIALNAIEYTRNMNGVPGTRHQVSHCTLIREEDVQRVKRLHASMDFSPILPLDEHLIEHAAEPFLGKERSQRVFPGRWAFNANAKPGLASDHAVTQITPFVDIEIMVTRGNPYTNSGEAIGKDLAITVEEGIKAYTINGAYVMMQENETGSIEAGKYADFIVLDQNLLEIPADAISETTVLQTYFEGKLVFAADIEAISQNINSNNELPEGLLTALLGHCASHKQ